MDFREYIGVESFSQTVVDGLAKSCVIINPRKSALARHEFFADYNAVTERLEKKYGECKRTDVSPRELIPKYGRSDLYAIHIRGGLAGFEFGSIGEAEVQDGVQVLDMIEDMLNDLSSSPIQVSLEDMDFRVSEYDNNGLRLLSLYSHGTTDVINEDIQIMITEKE